MGRKTYRAENIIVPRYVNTLHTLANFLVDNYVNKKTGDFRKQDRFNFLVTTAVHKSVPILETPKVTAKIIKREYRVSLSKRNSRQLEFIIEKIFETTLKT